MTTLKGAHDFSSKPSFAHTTLKSQTNHSKFNNDLIEEESQYGGKSSKSKGTRSIFNKSLYNDEEENKSQNRKDIVVVDGDQKSSSSRGSSKFSSLKSQGEPQHQLGMFSLFKKATERLQADAALKK